MTCREASNSAWRSPAPSRSTLHWSSPTNRPRTSTTSRWRACCASCATSPNPVGVVVVSTHDERLLPLADRVVELTPRAAAETRPPEPRTLAPGETLFRQGDAGDLVYVVDEGTVEIVRELAGGGEELLTTIDKPNYFGELAPMFGLRRAATARAGGTGASVTGYTLRDFRAQRRDADTADVLEGGADTVPD